GISIVRQTPIAGRDLILRFFFPIRPRKVLHNGAILCESELVILLLEVNSCDTESCIRREHRICRSLLVHRKPAFELSMICEHFGHFHLFGWSGCNRSDGATGVKSDVIVLVLSNKSP